VASVARDILKAPYRLDISKGRGAKKDMHGALLERRTIFNLRILVFFQRLEGNFILRSALQALVSNV
jgi:hypothetical protein